MYCSGGWNISFIWPVLLDCEMFYNIGLQFSTYGTLCCSISAFIGELGFWFWSWYDQKISCRSGFTTCEKSLKLFPVCDRAVLTSDSLTALPDYFINGADSNSTVCKFPFQGRKAQWLSQFQKVIWILITSLSLCLLFRPCVLIFSSWACEYH